MIWSGDLHFFGDFSETVYLFHQKNFLHYALALNLNLFVIGCN
jgi:hypothetical protein